MKTVALRLVPLALIAGTLAWALSTHFAPAQACLSVGGRGSQIQTADEEAIIVWDAAHHREDFIRRATFRTKVHDFGFLVPTPTVPTLTAVSPAIFTLMERVSAPALTRGKHEGEETAGFAPGVSVHRIQQVGAYEAAVLSADDPRGLGRWLARNGYVTPPGMAEWLTPYLKAHWTITAFKVGHDQQNTATASLPPVRLSFYTDKPFYPYREPISRDTSHRLLRVFFLTTGPASGAFDATANHAEWPGHVTTTHNLYGFDPNFGPEIARNLALSPSQMPSPLWITTFEDHSSPRPAVADLYFTDAPEKAAAH